MVWKALEVETADPLTEGSPGLIGQLAEGKVPATIFRQAISPSACQAIMARLIERDLLFDPAADIPSRFRQESIPEGHYREGSSDQALRAWRDDGAADRKIRIDIGSSLGYRGSDREAFLSHSAETRHHEVGFG